MEATKVNEEKVQDQGSVNELCSIRDGKELAQKLKGLNKNV